ncbi:MAG: type II toxin-antitoxin system Phd/YefM family antitoxin [Acidobacteriota bacterium]
MSYHGPMKVATISQTKNNLSALLDRVRHGETILIVDRNRPIARLEPVVPAGAGEEDGRLARLERAGLIRRSRQAVARDKTLARLPPKALKGGDILKALLSEREEGR